MEFIVYSSTVSCGAIDETLNYLIENAGNFTTDRFKGLLSEIRDQLKN
jgi:hypothetical protein